MSSGIALVVIRFELVDWSEESSFYYSAPNFELPMEKTTGTDKQKYGNTEELRGCRQIDELTIETITFNDSPRQSSQMESNGVIQPLSHNDSKPVTVQSNTESDGPQEGCSYAAAAAGKLFRPVSGSADSSGSRSPEWQGDTVGPVVKNRSKSATPKLSSTIDFYCGNPSVERIHGILHLYKDSKKTSMDDGASRSELICMLSVPASFTLHDLLQFTDHVYDGIEYMKIIRDMSPNHYMTLIKFKSQKLADEFYLNYNDTPFNSIESDVCHLVYVARVDLLKESEGGAVPIPGLVELPSCPVCLERMDESVDGVLTILCNHNFHGRCLKKWGDTSCPVCRYSQTPEQTGENYCFECSSTESLWICLICGQVGCGRYVDGHAYEHFARTNHTYAMQLSNGRVWDYVGDNYVHRLIQNKEDGKLVEMDEHGQRASDEKLDSLNLELESQRRYFEERITAVNLEWAEKLSKIDEQLSSVVSSHSEQTVDVESVTKSKVNVEKKCDQLSVQLKKTLKQLQEEQALNKSLLSNQQHWQSIIHKLEEGKQHKEQELKDTQEQLRDILFHLEAQNKLSECVDSKELEEGQISIGAGPQDNKPVRRSKKKK